MEPTKLRLNKFLALQLGLSRRGADEYISAGRVMINGTKAIIGSRFIEGDLISVDGAPLDPVTRSYSYILLNKPTDYVSSRRQQGESPTIYSLLPEELHILKPVGRLDRDSSGLMLLTNDGDFALEMTHPRYYKVKVYAVRLDHALAPIHQQMISDRGVTLEDGISKFDIQKEDDGSLQITMHEGRNRQIRRTFDALGYTVVYLHRTALGPYSLDDLGDGEFRPTERR